MRIAILLMVHKNIKQIERLLLKFDPKYCDVFIHIDKKSDLNPNNFESLQNNIFISKNRYDIVLFSFEMIRATLSLLDMARNRNNYDYYMLMSGQDYLLIPIHKIVDALEEYYPRGFMDVTPLHKGNWVYNSFARSNCFKNIRGKNNNRANHINNIVIKTIYKTFTVLPFKLVSYLRKSPYKTLSEFSIKMYGGSQWWILSRENIEDIITFYNNQTQAVKNALKYVGSPDETFFQVCLMNTKSKRLVDINDWTETNQNCMTFTVFTSKGHPIILTKENFEDIINSGKWVARKFDLDKCSTVLDMIDLHMKHDLI